MQSSKRSLRILQWITAQGITNISTRNELQNFINQHRIDIVFLCEALLKPNHKFYLNDYQIYPNDLTGHGGGVAICVNKIIQHKLLPAIETNTIENISISVKVHGRNVVLTSAYSPRYTTAFTQDIGKLTPTNVEFV